MTRVEATITDPLPTTGSMSLSDNGRMRLEVEIDLAGELARAVLTKVVPNFAALGDRAVRAVMAEMMRKIGGTPAVDAAMAQKADGVTH